MRQDSPPALPSTFRNSLCVQVLRHRVSFSSQIVTLWKGGGVPRSLLLPSSGWGSSLPQRHFSSHPDSDANPKCLSPTEPQAPAFPLPSGPLPDSKQLTHVDTGRMAMVDVGRKPDTRAGGRGLGRGPPGACGLQAHPGEPAAQEGDALAVAQLAGIQAAKLTSQLIPLCHHTWR